jgi:hypothetical protein
MSGFVTPKKDPIMRPPFPHTRENRLIVAPRGPAPDCGCMWAHIPELTRRADLPWALKYPNRACVLGHYGKVIG